MSVNIAVVHLFSLSYAIAGINHNLFVHSPIDGYLGCFQFYLFSYFPRAPCIQLGVELWGCSVCVCAVGFTPCFLYPAFLGTSGTLMFVGSKCQAPMSPGF